MIASSHGRTGAGVDQREERETPTRRDSTAPSMKMPSPPEPVRQRRRDRISAAIISRLPIITAESISVCATGRASRAVGHRIGDRDVEAAVVGDERPAGEQRSRASGRAGRVEDRRALGSPAAARRGLARLGFGDSSSLMDVEADEDQDDADQESRSASPRPGTPSVDSALAIAGTRCWPAPRPSGTPTCEKLP